MGVVQNDKSEKWFQHRAIDLFVHTPVCGVFFDIRLSKRADVSLDILCPCEVEYFDSITI